jgi:hypothetical protein
MDTKYRVLPLMLKWGLASVGLSFLFGGDDGDGCA